MSTKTNSSIISFRLLEDGDLEPWRVLRLKALRESPTAFLQSPEEFLELDDEQLKERIIADERHFTVGAFANHNQLIGMVGVFRELRPKIRHKASVWGTYLLPEFRGRGVGRQLMEFLLQQLYRIPNIEQVQLTVASSQAEARALYLSLGFEEYGAEKKAICVDGQFVDEFHLQMFLRKEAGPEATWPGSGGELFKPGHVEIFAQDPKRTEAFYRDALQFQTTQVQQDQFIWMKRGPLEILIRPGQPQPGPSTYQESKVGMVLYTDDLAASLTLLSRAGISPEGIDGSLKCPTFRDPDGNWFQLVNPADH